MVCVPLNVGERRYLLDTDLRKPLAHELNCAMLGKYCGLCPGKSCQPIAPSCIHTLRFPMSFKVTNIARLFCWTLCPAASLGQPRRSTLEGITVHVASCLQELRQKGVGDAALLNLGQFN